jgi:hypothetical protein
LTSTLVCGTSAAPKQFQKRTATQKEIEAESRSPLRNPAPTHGRQKKTAELNFVSILDYQLRRISLVTLSSPIVVMGMAMTVPQRNL